MSDPLTAAASQHRLAMVHLSQHITHAERTANQLAAETQVATGNFITEIPAKPRVAAAIEALKAAYDQLGAAFD